MEEIVLIVIIVLVISWAYKSGKRTGSRKGFNVGRDRAHRRRRW